ncbi:MAG: DUF4255 domain-containing protein, partial [Catenulispora sp.]
MVLDDVDASLAALLARRLPDGTTVSFEAPAANWAEEPPGKQVVNAFLYDVREEPDWLGADWEDVRDEQGRVIGRQPPPRRYELSYLVTAWAGDAALEHRLLSDVLRMAFTGEALPADCLVGSLVEAELPVLLRVVRKNPPQNPAAVWSDLNLPPRLVVDVAISAPLVPPMVTDLAPPAEGFHLGIGRGGPGGFAPRGPQGPQRPDASGMPVATPDQHWRSRMVDETEEPGDGAAGPDVWGAGEGGAGGSGAAGSGAGG